VSLNTWGSAAKNEFYSDSITELTTGTQMMKRLIEIGMIKEVADEKDRRVRRVELTDKGKKTRENIFEKSKPDLILKAGNLSEE